MSQGENLNSPSNTSNHKSKQRKKLLMLFAFVCVITAVSYLIYWLLVLNHYESTDDAYVAGNQVQIMPQVSGNIVTIGFDDTDRVKKGQVLVSLDKTDALLAFEKAKTQLATTVRQTQERIINSKQFQATVQQKMTAFAQAEADLRRREPLGKANLIGREDLQHTRDAVVSAKAALEAAKQQLNANQALLLDTPISDQPAVKNSAADVRTAWLNLQRTEIRSPTDGYVSRRSAQLGLMTSPSSTLMVVVPNNQLWINANFKETQLAKVRIGQTATITTDLYGDDVVFHGRVAGIDMGTGSAFSLLPAQNATGNWIKVVQRIPVRIQLDPKEIEKYPLRIGQSTVVDIDTKADSGRVLADSMRETPAYTTDVLSVPLSPVNETIAAIIKANAE
jgi:membrane fusion protein, multidrug efflux system